MIANMGNRIPPRWDYTLAFIGGALTVIVFIVPRTPQTVMVGLVAVFLLLVHPVWSLASWISVRGFRLRPWLSVGAAVVLVAVVVRIVGYFAWPSVNDRPPSAHEIADAVVQQISTQSAARTGSPLIAKPIVTSTEPADDVPGSHSHPLIKDPNDFIKLYEQLTSVKADALVEPFRGQWLVIRGRVINVDADKDANQVVIRDEDGVPVGLVVKLKAERSGAAVSMRFSERSQRKAVALMDRRNRMVARCQILYAAPWGLYTEKCELFND